MQESDGSAGNPARRRLYGYYSHKAREHMANVRTIKLATPGERPCPGTGSCLYERIGGGEVIVTLATEVPLAAGDGRYQWDDVVYVGELGAWLGDA